MKTYQPQALRLRMGRRGCAALQLEPVGYRGYMEGRPVRPVNKSRQPARKKAAVTPHPSQKKAPKSGTLQGRVVSLAPPKQAG